MQDSPGCLERRWVHVWEDDSGSTRTYRAEAVELPRSRRPRHLLQFRPDGSVLGRSAGPADARTSREGRWERSDPDLVTIRWDDVPLGAVLRVLECTEDRLRIDAIEGSIEPASMVDRGSGVR